MPGPSFVMVPDYLSAYLVTSSSIQNVISNHRSVYPCVFPRWRILNSYLSCLGQMSLYHYISRSLSSPLSFKTVYGKCAACLCVHACINRIKNNGKWFLLCQTYRLTVVLRLRFPKSGPLRSPGLQVTDSQALMVHPLVDADNMQKCDGHQWLLSTS